MKLDAVIQLHATGDLGSAEHGYRTLLAESKDSPVLYSNLALICLMTGRREEGIELLESSLSLNPNNPETYLNLGVAHKEQGRLEGAISFYHQALELNPAYSEAHNNLGVVLHEQGKLEQAVASYSMAVALKPNYPEAHYNLGNAYKDQGRLADAIAKYHQALQFRPDYLLAYLNLGNAFQELHQWDDAIVCCRRVLEIDPLYAEGHNNLGNALRGKGLYEDAISCYSKARELRPTYAQAHYNWGLILRDQGKYDEAGEAFEQVMEIKSGHLKSTNPGKKLAKLLLELEKIPVVYANAAEIEKYRGQYTSCLREASALVAKKKNDFGLEERSLLREILFRINNFYLAYQQQNDKELQMSYSALATDILSQEVGSFMAVKQSQKSGSKIRIGIASEYLRKHNGAFWSYGWLSNLPQADYEFFLYSLNGLSDELTHKFAALGTFRLLPFTQNNYLKSLEIIQQDKLDVLLLPDVGMTPSSRILSLLRLAPVQCVGWGHPVTTGSPNIDYYLSGDLVETEDSDSHYSEKLIRLPNLGLHLDPPAAPAEDLTRSDFGIPKTKTVYGAVQSLFKYLPQFDFVYPAIAKQVPNALFVFVEGTSDFVTASFVARLEKAFEKEGLSFSKHVKILPQMPLARFMQLLGVLDVYLDSIGFSGAITAIRSLEMNCPVVTVKSEFMRGRLGHGVLKMAGVEDLIADSPKKFVALASKLGADKKFRLAMVEKIKAGKHKLYNDQQCVEHLDEFFKSEVGKARENSPRR